MSRAQQCVDRVASRSAQPEDGRTSLAPAAQGGHARIETPWVVVLTRDAELGTSIRQAVDSSRVTVVESVDAAEEAASGGHCAILITDEAGTHRACAAMGERLRRHDAAMVMIAVGHRGQDNALIGLLSTGAADRLMLKPVTPALSKIVIESAAREHRARNLRNAVVRMESPAPRHSVIAEANTMTQPVRVTSASTAASAKATTSPSENIVETATALVRIEAQPGSNRWLTWLGVAAAALVIAGWIWWIATQPAALPRAIQTAPAVHPADRWLADAGRAIDESKFVEAITALQSARREGAPDERIELLEARLRQALERRLASAPAPAAETVEATQAQDVHPIAAPVRASNTIAEAAAPKDLVQPIAAAPEKERAGERVPVVPIRQMDVQPAKLAARPEQQRNIMPSDDAAPLEPPPMIEAAPSEAAETNERHEHVPSAAEERKVLRMVKPAYPSEARVRGIEGWTDVSFSVSAAGDILDPRVEDSSMKQLFARPALSAVKQWRYEPSAGASERERIRVRVEFRAPD